MGKIVTIYLSDEEARDLKEFCEENRCTQYSVLKTALRDILYKPVKLAIEEEPTSHEDEPLEVQTPEIETEEGISEEKEQTKKEGTSNAPSLLRRLLEQSRAK